MLPRASHADARLGGRGAGLPTRFRKSGFMSQPVSRTSRTRMRTMCLDGESVLGRFSDVDVAGATRRDA
jgi:hypothetical protein